MRKLTEPCHEAIPSYDDHLTCAKCWFAAGNCALDAKTPAQPVRAGLLPGASFGSPSQIPNRKQTTEEPSTGRAMFPHFRLGFNLLLPAQNGYQRLVPLLICI